MHIQLVQIYHCNRFQIQYVYSAIEYSGSAIKIVYYIPINSFNVVTSMVDDWRNYSLKKDSYSVLAKEEFEHRFETDLLMHTANIKEEIEINGK